MTLIDQTFDILEINSFQVVVKTVCHHARKSGHAYGQVLATIRDTNDRYVGTIAVTMIKDTDDENKYVLQYDYDHSALDKGDLDSILDELMEKYGFDWDPDLPEIQGDDSVDHGGEFAGVDYDHLDLGGLDEIPSFGRSPLGHLADFIDNPFDDAYGPTPPNPPSRVEDDPFGADRLAPPGGYPPNPSDGGKAVIGDTGFSRRYDRGGTPKSRRKRK